MRRFIPLYSSRVATGSRSLRGLVGAILVVVLAASPFTVRAATELPLAQGVPEVTKNVPGDSIVFLHLPNLSATARGYDGSNLKKIVNAPETAAVRDALWATLKKAMLQSVVNPSIEDPAELKKEKDKIFETNYARVLELALPILPLLDGESFIAWSGFDFDAKGAGPVGLSGKFIAGIKPKSGTDNFDAYVALVKAKAKEYGNDLDPLTGTDTVEGVKYEFIQPAKGERASKALRLCCARYKGWVLFSIGDSGLASFIQRDTGKLKGSLAEAKDAGEVWAKLHKDPEAEAVFNMPAFVAFLNQTPDLRMRTEMKKLSNDNLNLVGASCKFNGPLIEDRYASSLLPAAATERDQVATPCAFNTLRFTSASTIYYQARHLDLPALIKAYEKDQEGFAQQLVDWRAEAAKLNINLDDIIAAAGDEFCITVDSDGKGLPEGGLIVPLAKPEKLAAAAAFVEKTVGTGFVEGSFSFKMDTIGQYRVVEVSYPRAPMIPPSIVTIGGGPLLAFLSSRETAERLLAKPPAPTTVVDQDAFKRVILGDYKTYAYLCFINTPAVISQASPLLRGLYGAYAPLYLAKDMPALASLTLPETLIVPDLATPWAMGSNLDGNIFVTRSLSGIGNPVSTVYTTSVTSLVAIVTLQQLGSQVQSTFDKINDKLEKAKDEEEK